MKGSIVVVALLVCCLAAADDEKRPKGTLGIVDKIKKSLIDRNHMQKLVGGDGEPIALANVNKVVQLSSGDGGNAQAKAKEKSMKKKEEIGVKRSMEEKMKLNAEESSKFSKLEQQKTRKESKSKRFQQRLSSVSEEAAKKAREEMTTQVSLARQEIEHAQKKVLEVQADIQREREVSAARDKIKESYAKGQTALMRKEALEGVTKLTKKNELKSKENKRKTKRKRAEFKAKQYAKKQLAKRRQELKKARAAERKEKNRKRESAQKRRGRERSKKQEKKMKEKQSKLAAKERMDKARLEKKKKFKIRQEQKAKEKKRKAFKERVGKYTTIPQSRHGFRPVQSKVRAAATTIPNSGVYSYTVWIKPLGIVPGQWANLFHKGTHNGERNPAVWFYPGTTRLHCRSGTHNDWNAGSDPGEHLSIGKWTHLAITHSGSEMRVYLDGQVRAWNRYPGPRMNNGPLYTSDPWYPAANVKMTDLRMYSRVLEPREVSYIITKGRPK